MFRLFIIIFFVISLKAEFLGEIELQKDEIKTLNIFVENTTKILTLRWTLYKDKALVTHLKYDFIPHQFILYKDNLNSYKVYLSGINSNKSEDSYIIFYFVDFNEVTRKAKFRYYLFRFANNIEVM